MTIIENITEKIRDKHVKTSQMSERTMNETLEKLAKIIKEDASEEDALAIFETLAGNIRKEKSDFAKEFEKTQKKDEKKEEKKDEKKDEEEPETPEWAKSIISKFQTYDEKFAEQEKVKTAEKVRKEVLGKVKIYPDSVVDIVSDGFDFTQEGAEEKFIEKVSAAAGKLGVTPEKEKPKDQKPDFSSFTGRLKERGLIPETKN